MTLLSWISATILPNIPVFNKKKIDKIWIWFESGWCSTVPAIVTHKLDFLQWIHTLRLPGIRQEVQKTPEWWEPKVSTIWNFSSNSWYWGTNPINLKILQFHRLLCGNSSSQRYPDLPLHWPDDAQQPQRDLAQKLSFCGTCLAGKGFRMICPQACGANLTLASCWWKANLPCWDERQSSTMPGSTFSCLLEYGREKICCS